MNKTYRETFLLRTSGCDTMGTWRPGAIFEAMQEASGMHSHLLGCGRSALIAQGLVWVLSRAQVNMRAYPRAAETVAVETFPMKNRRWFCPRYFVFSSEGGEILGCASTLWVLMDVASRRMVPPDAVVHLIPDNANLTAPMGWPETVEEPQGGCLFSRTPAFSDLDMNGHVNNTKYLDWLCDALGLDLLRKKAIGSISVNYDAEILPGQEMALRLSLEGDRFTLFGFHGDKRHFAIGGTLMDRARG